MLEDLDSSCTSSLADEILWTAAEAFLSCTMKGDCESANFGCRGFGLRIRGLPFPVALCEAAPGLMGLGEFLPLGGGMWEDVVAVEGGKGKTFPGCLGGGVWEDLVAMEEGKGATFPVRFDRILGEHLPIGSE